MNTITTDAPPTDAFAWLMLSGKEWHEYLLINRFLFIVSWDGESRMLFAQQYATPADACKAAIVQTEIDESFGLKLDDFTFTYNVGLSWEDLESLRKSHDAQAVMEIAREAVTEGGLLG